MVMAFWLVVHSAPYVFVLSAVGNLLGSSLIGSRFRIEHQAFGIGFGIAFGIAGAISLTRIYYQLVHLPFVWPRSHGGWYPRHPVAWDDLCGVPFPGLDGLLVEYAENVPESGVAKIER